MLDSLDLEDFWQHFLAEKTYATSPITKGYPSSPPPSVSLHGTGHRDLLRVDAGVEQLAAQHRLHRAAVIAT